MKLIRKLAISFVLSLLLVYISFNFSVIPCKKTHNLINVYSSWETCSFSLTTGKIIGENLYFGKYSEPLEAIMFFLAVSFIAIFLILTILLRKKGS